VLARLDEVARSNFQQMNDDNFYDLQEDWKAEIDEMLAEIRQKEQVSFHQWKFKNFPQIPPSSPPLSNPSCPSEIAKKFFNYRLRGRGRRPSALAECGRERRARGRASGCGCTAPRNCTLFPAHRNPPAAAFVRPFNVCR